MFTLGDFLKKFTSEHDPDKTAEIQAKAVERYRRDLAIHEKREAGMTQQAIADEVGLSRERVKQVLVEKPGIPQKTTKPKRHQPKVSISPNSNPATIANRIHEKLHYR